MYIYVHTHAHTHAHTHTHTHTHARTRSHTHARAHTYTHRFAMEGVDAGNEGVSVVAGQGGEEEDTLLATASVETQKRCA